MKQVNIVLMLMIATATVNAQVTAIRAGRLIDPETRKIESNQMIVVEGRDIKAVGSNVAMPAGATVIDLSRYTVMPGIVERLRHMSPVNLDMKYFSQLVGCSW